MQGTAELQTGPGSSRRQPRGGSDSGTESEADVSGGGRVPRRCCSREQLAEAAAASREQLASARSGMRGRKSLAV